MELDASYSQKKHSIKTQKNRTWILLFLDHLEGTYQIKHLCPTGFWNVSMVHPLLHEVAQNQVSLFMHGILNQGHMPKDCATKLRVEKLQNCFKIKLLMFLLLALCFM